MQLSPHIHWIEGINANVYLGLSPGGLTLFDTGMPGSDRVDGIANYLERLGRRLDDITRIVITHADIDHAGNVASLLAKTDAIVYAGEACFELMRNGRSPQHLPGLIQALSDRFFRYPPVTTEKYFLIRDGETLPFMDGLRVLATPGHTPDHFSFYHPPSGVCIVGDALNTRRGRLQLSPKPISADYAAVVASARKLAQLPTAVYACGHGPPLDQFTFADLINLFPH